MKLSIRRPDYYVLTAILLLFITNISTAQVKLPSVLLPSPEAAEIAKYGAIPVSTFSGIPNISIPVYTIKEKDIEVPITLSYHAAGIKVNDFSTWIGTGWSLNAGGSISRVVKGRPDEDPYGILSTGKIPLATEINQSKYTFCEDVAKQVVDTEPDQFFYNFSNYSGSFVFSAKGQIEMSPYDPRLIISFINNDYFKVTTEKGIEYYFTEKEASTSLNEGGSTSFYSATTTWYISKIISANKKDSVNFTYSSITRPNERTYGNSASFGGSVQDNDSNGDINRQFLDGVYKSDYVNFFRNENVKYLNTISFVNGTVTFTPEQGTRTDYDGGYILKNILVKNNNNKTIKNTQLEHGYFYSNNGFNPYALDEDKSRLKLLSVDELDTNSALVEKYRLTYNENTLLPPRKNCGIDYWGYYNGHAENQTLLNSDEGGRIVHLNGRDYDLVVFANRDVDEQSMKACILNRIYYPTGGYTDFDFESNKIPSIQSNFGTIIYSASAKIDDVPNDPDRINTFVADTALATSLVLNVPLYNDGNKPAAIFEDLTTGSFNRYTTFPGQNSFQTIPITLVKGHTYRLTTQLVVTGASGEDPDMEVLMSIKWNKLQSITNTLQNVGGLRIKSIQSYLADGTLTAKEAYKYGANEDGAGNLSFFPNVLNKRSFPMRYVYWMVFGIARVKPYYYDRKDIVADPIYNLSNYEGGLCAYTTVTKYTGINDQDLQKTVDTFDFELDDQVDDSRNTSKPTLISNAWKSGSLLQEEQFKKINGGFSLIKQTTNKYNIIQRDTTLGLAINRASIENVGTYLPDQSSNGNNSLPNPPFSLTVSGDYNWFNYTKISGAKILTEKAETLFETSGSVSSIETYNYNNLNHLQPTSIVTNNSKNQTLSTIMKYPAEMVSTGRDPLGVYAAMINRNMVTTAIEYSHLNNTVQTNLTRDNYYLTSYNQPEKQSLEIQNMQFAPEIRITYKDYNDRGDILNVSYANGPNVGYQWGYNAQYPTAEARNALNTEFYYEGYEENTAGGTTVGLGHTGIKYTTNTTISWARPNSRNYVISYWYRSGGIWKYQTEQTYTASSFTMTGGDAYDDVRIYPKDAQMTTYTYDPLVGMTSSTDSKEKTTTYEYDRFQRLMNIKDMDGNILKHTDYHYQGQ